MQLLHLLDLRVKRGERRFSRCFGRHRRRSRVGIGNGRRLLGCRLFLLHVTHKRPPLVLKTWQVGSCYFYICFPCVIDIIDIIDITPTTTERVPSPEQVNLCLCFRRRCRLCELGRHPPRLLRPLALHPQDRRARPKNCRQRHDRNLLLGNVQVPRPPRALALAPHHARPLLVVLFLHVHVVNPPPHLVQPHRVRLHVPPRQPRQKDRRKRRIAYNLRQLRLGKRRHRHALHPMAERPMHAAASRAHKRPES